MNTSVTLAGVTLTPATITHSPERISTTNVYKSGRKQEYYRNTKHRTELLCVVNEADRLTIENTIFRASATISFTDEHARTYTVKPVEMQAALMDGSSPTVPKFAVTISIEEV